MAPRQNQRQSKRYPAAELLAAAIGVAITVGMFGFLAYEAVLQRNESAPVMEVRPVGLVTAAGSYVVEVEVRNISRQTGANVELEGSLKRGGSTVETSDATLDHVPGGSSRRAGLAFTRDPRNYQLELRATGYERP